jgi:glyoxylase-like metal-dependent hydrolase (beta-lactamase superfamily II)
LSQEIKAIRLGLPYHLGSVNCYLIHTDTGYVLIDTGCSNQRTALEQELEGAGCRPGNLKLIILTHGDFDHAGNAAFLRQRFGTPVAMHSDDFGMVKRGDMFWNRNKGNRLLRRIAPLLLRFGQSEIFEPDVSVADGSDLSQYGFEATVLSLLGHSKGSIGVQTSCGALFCGDLLENTKRPALSWIMDDGAAAAASVDKLKRLGIATVYPGHGQPFLWESFVNNAGASLS